ncbi:MBOAT family O-acyltransferase [Mangrovimonas xylaniphaga]|uniref:MBOAT family O-acyltransferase n=1 Tax=Mangrovimonas xylaniphaga TaxID=1645915 RepID=UPI0006B4E106|nr:MBOAT family O-acyltransferase [Mangrovimonas xylaniphaga]
MLFNSLTFAVFLPLVFMLYWFVFRHSLKRQNVLVLLASYVFYGWWDWRFLGLILLSTLVDFFVGLQLRKTETPKQRKFYLLLSLCVNLGLLGFFKYYHFFIESWIDAWSLFGIQMHASTLEIILPVGISFYTFQTLSYTIDVYRKQLEATRDFLQFATFVAFFPQLVAGPIERASHLLPQFANARRFDADFAYSGISLIIWGLFKKVVVADNCAFFVNQIFEGYGHLNSAELFLGVLLFGIQIYGDFSGYSDIAIGVGRLFGFSLQTNFAFPYFSRSISEFWRRWHISLSSWFRDYVYIPLGGSRGSLGMHARNICVVFLVSGLWHGANWTFLVWGAVHAFLFLVPLLFKVSQNHGRETQLAGYQFPSMLLTFLMVCLAWVFFRADSVPIAWDMLGKIFSFEGHSLGVFYKNSKSLLFAVITVVGIFVLWLYEFLAVQGNQQEVRLSRYHAIFIGVLIVFMGVYKNPSDFIYFQF